MSSVNALDVVGVGVISPAGYGVEPLRARFSGGVEPLPDIDASTLFADPLPPGASAVLADFDVRAHLGRKGTSNFDRVTSLAVVACQQTLTSAGYLVDETNATRTGVTMGTTEGSFKSTSDFTRETFVNDKPYLVNPSLFPNTIMNGAAGQVAIRFGLRGINATVAGGPLAYLNALRYAQTVIGRGYVDTMLVGGVEEFSPHRAWLAYRAGAEPAGEAAVITLVSRSDGADLGLRVLATAAGFGADDESTHRALAGCVRRVLRSAGVDSRAVGTLFTTEANTGDTSEFEAVVDALGHKPQRRLVTPVLGNCGCAAAGVALVVAGIGGDRPTSGEPGYTLISARDSDGAVAVALLQLGGTVDDHRQ